VQLRDSHLLLSATDLVNFHECEHLSALDRAALDDKSLRALKTKPDDQAELFFRKGRSRDTERPARRRVRASQSPRPSSGMDACSRSASDQSRSAARGHRQWHKGDQR
jgi:hypothetical protein